LWFVAYGAQVSSKIENFGIFANIRKPKTKNQKAQKQKKGSESQPETANQNQDKPPRAAPFLGGVPSRSAPWGPV
jgi:hypothetical protein